MIRQALAIVALVAVAACDDARTPFEPSRPLDRSQQAVSIAITGNTSLAKPGDTSQLTATVTFADSTTRDVTGTADWYPRDTAWSRVVTIRAGLMTAVGYGRAPITVHYRTPLGTVNGSATASVLPPDTFLLEGKVTEGAFTLSGATVDITLQPGLRFSAVSDMDGTYQVPAAGSVTVTATKEGFAAEVKHLTVSRDMKLDFDLRRPAAADDIRGVYSLMMMASASCTLPASLMRRSYVARIAQENNAVTVEVAGANMEAWGTPGFTGVRDGGTVRFTIYGFDDLFSDHPVFVERIDGSMNLAYEGTATGPIDARRIVATFNGTLQYRSVAGAVRAECQAPDHRLELSR